MVLIKKTNAHDVVVWFKALVVTRGFSQNLGIDFKDTFASTLEVMPLCELLSISASFNVELYHLDIEMTFLHGQLDEEISIEQLTYILDPQFWDNVCELHKSLYSLKMSLRVGHFKLHTYFVSIGFNHSQISTFTRRAISM